MLKFLLKLLAWVGAIAAALAALAYFDKAKANDYIEIYSDDEMCSEPEAEERSLPPARPEAAFRYGKLRQTSKAPSARQRAEGAFFYKAPCITRRTAALCTAARNIFRGRRPAFR